jgi:hypothetical protein
VTEQSFNIVDIKPSNMEDLTEVSQAPQVIIIPHVMPLHTSGDHLCRVPPFPLQRACIQQQQGLHQAR